MGQLIVWIPDKKNPPSLENTHKCTVDTIFVDIMSLPEEMYHYLTSTLNLDRNQALGLITNAQRESNLNLVAINHNGISGCLFQWSGSRLTKMKANVPNWNNSWKAQFHYALEEDVGPQYILKNFTTPQEAADWWMLHWVRPSNKTQARLKNDKILASYNF